MFMRNLELTLIDEAIGRTDVITEVRRQEALLTSEALQNAIFHSANFSSIATDARGVIQIFNVGAERMLGYEATEVKNKITPADISDPQEVIARAKALSAELETSISPGFEALVFKASRGIEDIYELTYIRKDGSRFPAVVSVTALRDARNLIIGYLLIGTDNTVRKQIEEERLKLDQRLRDHQFYTRSLIEANIDAIMTTDPQGIITDVNKQMEALTACTRDELIGAPFKNNFTDPERAEAGIKQVLNEGMVVNYQLTVCGRNGKETVVSFNATIFYDRERRPQGVFAAARDITERKAVEKELLASELFAKATLDAASSHICVLDKAGMILAVNQAWRDFYDANSPDPTQLNPSCSVGANYLEICDCASGPGSDEAGLMGDDIRKVIKGEADEFTVEYPCHSATEKRWFIARVTRFHGGSGNVVVAHENISARKRAELREQHHNRVLQLLAAKAPLSNVLDAIARDVEAINPAMLCSILLLDADGENPRHGAAPSLPEFFNQAIAGVAIGTGVGSCGTAAFTGLQLIVEDIEKHPCWAPYLDLTRRVGLGACWSQPIFSGQGQVLGMFAIYHRHARAPTPADLRLIEDEARLAALSIEKTTAEVRLQLAASVFTHAREGIMITDADGTIVEVNDTFSRITGYSREETMGANPRVLEYGRQTPDYYAAMWRGLTDKGHWYGEAWNRRKNGEMYAVMITISAVSDSTGRTQNYVALFSDITSMKQHERQLEHIAHYDALTGLPNRVLLADRLQQGIIQSQRRMRSLAVVFLDLDGFKAVNDAHGHDVGDELLVALAQRMKAALRDGDTLARVGGDEFVAILVDLDCARDCEPVLARMLQAASDPVTARAQVLHVSASIGVTLYPQDGGDADLLMRHADQAMYQAKQAGRNRYQLFDVAQEVALQTFHEGLHQIRRALDKEEFVLYYQPKVNMLTRKVIGVEALIRWQHPTRGLLSPAAFLPKIEDYPISVELGEWVVANALAQMTQWHAVGLDMPVSVNIGARQLQQDNFVPRLLELMGAHPDLPSHHLELEVLETSALEDMTKVSQVMHACRQMGVRFALDDFGTGYSSLTYLKRLPAEVIKIDQSFVRDMLDDPDDLAIVKGIIGLAAAFHREVIAEGVETPAHGELLLSLGCELAQGFGIARPMPASELPGWLASWRADAA
jgi:diguanylate cyclase (GGDEF)-like protein/PAS domain S-box-containing protein